MPSISANQRMGGMASPRDAAVRQSGATERARLPLLTKVVLISLLIPAFFSVGSIVLTPSKFLFLFVVPVLTVNLLRGKYGRLLAPDYLIFGYAAWMTLAMLVNHTPRVAIEYTGSNTVILLGGYLTARATIRDKATFVALVRFLAWVVVLSLPFALYEVITSKTTIPRWIGQIPNVRSHGDINHDPRFGMWRAQVVFPHPIHYGIYCSFMFSLVYVGLYERLDWFRRAVVTSIVGMCCFFSVSSGPVLAVMAQIGLIGYAALFKNVERRWTLFWSVSIFAYIVAELASTRSAIYAIVTRISFNPSTAFSRRILFNYGVEQIQRTPVFGVGYNPWPLPAWMTGSVDNFWLFVAVRFGMPAFLLLAATFIVSMVLAGRRDFRADPELLVLRRAWIFTLISVILVLGTVAIWGEVYSMVLFMLGSGIWFLTTNPTQTTTEEEPVTETRTLRYSRFPVRATPRTRVTSTSAPS